MISATACVSNPSEYDTQTPASTPSEEELLTALSKMIMSWETLHTGVQFNAAWQTEVEGGDHIWSVDWFASGRRKKDRIHETKIEGSEIVDNLASSLQTLADRHGIMITHVARPRERILVWWTDAQGVQQYLQGEAL